MKCQPQVHASSHKVYLILPPYLYSAVPSPMERNVLEFRISKLFGQMTRASASGKRASEPVSEAAIGSARAESILPSMVRLIGARSDGGIEL